MTTFESDAKKEERHLFHEPTSGHLNSRSPRLPPVSVLPPPLLCAVLSSCSAIASLSQLPPSIEFLSSLHFYHSHIPHPLSVSSSPFSSACPRNHPPLSLLLPPPLLRGEGNNVSALGGCSRAVWPRRDSLFKHGGSACTLNPH